MHNPPANEHIRIDDPSLLQCDSDSSIVGGPIEHHPQLYFTHVRWAKDPDKCWDSIVCQHHLAWGAMFMAGEEAPAYYSDEFVELRIEPIPIGLVRRRPA